VIAVLHASLSSAFVCLRQAVISSALGMNALQSRNTSGVHAKRCSGVPCEKEGESVAQSKASDMSDRANGAVPICLELPCSSEVLAIYGRSRYSASSWQISYRPMGVRACSEKSVFVAFDRCGQPLRLEQLREVARFSREPGFGAPRAGK
jgi:hypothetical protein